MATYNRNLYRIQELVSAGEIGGLLTHAQPLHSVTFDGTPVAKQDGQVNFRGAKIVERTGAANQSPVSGFESVSLTESVGVELEDTQEWISRQVGNGFSRVRVFLRYPNGLFRYSSKGKYQSWDMRYDIEVSTDNSAWTSAVQIRSSNRTQQSFDRVHVIENPNSDGESQFYIRCRRARGPGNDRETGTLFWHANVQLEKSIQSYPDTAYYSIEFDAQQLGNVLPERGYHIRGIRCLVPTTYEPTLYDGTTGEITRHAYYSSTVWDGSFKLEHCTDAAWIGYNLLVNEKWGAGKSIDADLVDVFSFWEASKYNVELIDNGVDAPHPRFVFNGRIADIKDMRAHCDEVLATAQASTYEEDGLIKCFQDHPASPSKIFIPANIVGGMVERQSNSLEGRLTVCEVTFNDRTDRFEPTTEVVEVEQSLIDAYGYRIANIAQNGVTERPQAIRAARWQIENSHIEGGSATLAVGWENWDTSIGDVVYILDDVLNHDAISGRVISVNGLTITLDRMVNRNVVNEKMIIQTSSGLVEVIANASLGSEIVSVSQAVEALRLDAFVISNDLNQYRVNGYSVSQGEKRLVCGFHDPTKYARIEVGEDYTPEYPPLDPDDILPPTKLTAFGNISDGIHSVYIDWAVPLNPEDPTLPDTRVANYVLEWDGPLGRDEITVQDSSYQIEPADLGVYEFTVTAYTTNGTPSPSVSYSLTFIPDGSSELLPPSLNADFSGKDLLLSWVDNPNNATNSRYVPVAYVLDFSDDETSVSSSVRVPFTEESVLHRHTYNFDDNTADHGDPSRTIYVTIRVEDNMGLLSVANKSGVSNTAPLAPRQSLASGFNTIQVSIDHDAVLPDWERDVAGFLIEVNGDAIDIGNNTLTSFKGQPEVDYVVRSAAYDLFGKVDLNWSASESVRVDSIEPPTIPDFSRITYLFTGLEWSINPDNGTLSWDDHVASQYTWNSNTDAYDIIKSDINAGSLTYVSGLSYIALDFETGVYVRTTFDDWFKDSDYLMGEVRSVDGVFAWYEDGIDKLAVNAISAKHIQADAIVGEKINSKTVIVVGDRETGPNVLILDGTAEGAEAIIWAGNQNSGSAGFAVLANGDGVIRGNWSVGGGTILEKDTTMKGSLDIAGKFFVDADTGDTSIGGKLDIAGNLNVTGSGTIGKDIDILGRITADQIVGDIVSGQPKTIPGGRHNTANPGNVNFYHNLLTFNTTISSTGKNRTLTTSGLSLFVGIEAGATTTFTLQVVINGQIRASSATVGVNEWLTLPSSGVDIGTGAGSVVYRLYITRANNNIQAWYQLAQTTSIVCLIIPVGSEFT